MPLENKASGPESPAEPLAHAPDTHQAAQDTVRAVFGPVSLVRAIPSREVSVICIETPEDMHVAVTNLLYGKDALVRLVDAPKSEPRNSKSIAPTKYGVISADDLEGRTSGDASEVRFVHGHVFDVRAMRSKGITLISIEVPESAHVEVTQMLYGRDVLIFPVDLGHQTNYGVVVGRGNTVHTKNPVAKSVVKASTVVYPSRFESMIRPAKAFDPVRWCAIRCGEAEFQEFLGVHSADAAADEVRQICEIDSRSELSTNPRARLEFMEKIYKPYTSQGGGR